jgi:hypothetical protein
VNATTYYGLKVHRTPSGREYAYGTENQANEAAREYIRESLWAFRPEFIARYVPESVSEKIITAVVESGYEDSNEAIALLIGDKIGTFTDDAIATDGRGHFLSPYDGREISSDDIEGLPRGRLAYRIN